MNKDLIMVQLVEAIFWFDEALQAQLSAKGWDTISRRQSMILANLADGETRPSRIAEKLGISRQALSQALAEMTARGMITLEDDPDDKRAKIIAFSRDMEPMRQDAVEILNGLVT
ncbi:MarR family transcriptional regulator [Sphingorhabdus sp. SMR4y]|uniref:MarR family transcriptional regulator n=1 Tax=Sphingorhabdus sp. SMR4y TaxID=2584094 RepID=UPI0016420739|nr:helix-turn-helix domain-containing protein [Sphingorhabdus sp. SMR4y]